MSETAFHPSKERAILAHTAFHPSKERAILAHTAAAQAVHRQVLDNVQNRLSRFQRTRHLGPPRRREGLDDVSCIHSHYFCLSPNDGWPCHPCNTRKTHG
jgi:hypothetical protein